MKRCLLLRNIRGAVSMVTDLEMMIGNERVTESKSTAYYGNKGNITVYPTTEEEISRILKYANDNGKKIVIEGNGSKKGFGGQLETYDICLSMRDYRGIVDHAVGDMTITVKAGTPFQEVQAHLKKAKQRISLDPYSMASGTVGGIIAANDSGPRRLSYGSARDCVIGMRVIYPDGTLTRCGGKVVKNVAGYDMNKLFIGSMGTLAVITEITFKVKPTAQYESLIAISLPKNEANKLKEIAVKLLDSMMEPVYLQYLTSDLSQKLLNEAHPTLVIAFEDVKSSVHYEENFVKNLLPTNAKVQMKSQEESEKFWSDLAQITPVAQNIENEATNISVALKIGVKNMDIVKIMACCEKISEEKQVEIYAHGSFGHGLCEVSINGQPNDVKNTIQKIQTCVSGLNGHMTIKHAPFYIRKEISVWPENIGTLFLMQDIKKKCDPNGVLNEKRFVGGI